MNKVVVITGGADGIGYALAKKCAKNSMDLVLADLNKDKLFAVARELSTSKINILPVVTDVRDYKSVEKLANLSFDNFKRVDWLFNNAGISGEIGPVWELSLEKIKQVLDVNLLGVVHGIKAFVPRMLAKSHSSHVINMSSMLGLSACSNFAPYVMSKFGVVGLSEVLYHDLQAIDSLIKVSVVCPEFINTNLIRNSSFNKDQKIVNDIQDLFALGMSPSMLADFIIQEVQHNKFYILTKQVKKIIRQRNEDFKSAANPSPNALTRILSHLIT